MITNRKEVDALIKKFWPEALVIPNPEAYGDLDRQSVLLSIVGFCGCGGPGLTASWLRDLLRLHDTASTDLSGTGTARDTFWKEATGKSFGPVYYLIHYWLDDRGWTEHGGSVGGGWLTEKGRAVIAVLDLIIELESLEEQGESK